MSSRTLNTSGWGDIFWLQAQIASWCPAWEPKAEQLLTDVDAQKTLMDNANFDKLRLAAEKLSIMREQLAKMQSDSFGLVLSLADSKSIADKIRLASRTVCVTYALFKLRVALPQVTVRRQQIEAAKVFQQEIVGKGATLPASLQKVLDSFIDGKGGAVDPPKVQT